MWASLAPHQKPHSNFTPAKLITFPWEKEENTVTDLEALRKNVLDHNKVFWDRYDKKIVA